MNIIENSDVALSKTRFRSFDVESIPRYSEMNTLLAVTSGVGQFKICDIPAD